MAEKDDLSVYNDVDIPGDFQVNLADIPGQAATPELRQAAQECFEGTLNSVLLIEQNPEYDYKDSPSFGYKLQKAAREQEGMPFDFTLENVLAEGVRKELELQKEEKQGYLYQTIRMINDRIRKELKTGRRFDSPVKD